MSSSYNKNTNPSSSMPSMPGEYQQSKMDQGVQIRMTKTDLSFVQQRDIDPSQLDPEQRKHLAKIKNAEKKRSLFEQLNINNEIRQSSFAEKFKKRGLKRLDDEESRYLESYRQLKLDIENQHQEDMKESLKRFEEDLSKLSQMPKEEIEEYQQRFFRMPQFAKKEKSILADEQTLETLVDSVEIIEANNNDNNIDLGISGASKKRKADIINPLSNNAIQENVVELEKTKKLKRTLVDYPDSSSSDDES